MSSIFEIQGLTDLNNAIKELRRVHTNEFATRAIQQAGAYMARKVRAAAPKGKKDLLKKSIIGKRIRQGRGGRGSMAYGALVMARYSIAPHSHLVEFGHRMVTHSGREVGRVEGHPFFWNTISEHSNVALLIIREGTWKAVRTIWGLR